MPAEWEPHAATWLAWPHFHGDWPGRFEPIPWVYAEIIRNLAPHERVELIVNHTSAEKQARNLLKRADAFSQNVHFRRWPTNRVWTRDSSCIFVTKSGAGAHAREKHAVRTEAGLARIVRTILEKTHFNFDPVLREGEGFQPRCANREGHDFAVEPALSKRSASKGAAQRRKKAGASALEAPLLALKFRFNAWAKYSNWRHDEKLGTLIAKAARAHEIRPLSAQTRVVLEGGSIDVNGHGTVLTTEECLLSKEQERNPQMTRVHYEKLFADYFGAPNVIWLGRGIFGDDTHGHVDDLTRFVSKDTVVTMVEPNSKDVNHAPLRANLRRLQAARDQDGKPLNIVEIPMPQPVVFQGRRLPASYANFYIANGIVLAPVFNRPNDRIALNTLAQLFPKRQIIPIYSGDFIWGFGAMHCMTQQQPSASSPQPSGKSQAERNRL
jgi:agmatine/peptidylarginine deiminase